MGRRAAAIATTIPLLLLGACSSDNDDATPTTAAAAETTVEEALGYDDDTIDTDDDTDDYSDTGNTLIASWGETIDYEDGVSFSVTKPVPTTVSEYYQDEYTNPVEITITVTNNSNEAYDAGLTIIDVTSAGSSAEAIFDTEAGYDGQYSSILPGKSLSWKAAYDVAAPDDVTVEVTDFFRESAYFTD